MKRLLCALLGGIGILTSGCSKKQYSWATEEDYYKLPIWKQHVRSYKHLRYKPNTAIIFIGDSMTEGFDLLRHLSKPNLVNMGISGDFTSGVLDRLQYATRLEPTKIFVMIGINDILKSVPQDRIKKQYEAIILELKNESPSSEIYIQGNLPTAGIGGNVEANKVILDQIVDLNNFLAQITVEYGIHFIDLYLDFSNENQELRSDLTYDGLHLNDDGYKVWAAKIFKYLQD